MSRLEKYRAHRERIKNDNKIKSALNESSPLIKHIMKTLNDINPKILSTYKPIEIKLIDVLTIDTSNKDNINIIQSFLDNFNFEELIDIRERAELLLLTSKKENNLEFEKDWLNQDKGIEQINNCNKMFNEVQDENLLFDKVSKDDYRRFNDIIKKTRENSVKHNINIYKKYSNIKHSFSWYRFYMTIFWSLLPLILVILIISILIILNV